TPEGSGPPRQGPGCGIRLAKEAMPLEVLTSYTWPTTPMGLATLHVRVDDLAGRLGVAVQTWTEDGLGPPRGLGGRLPSRRAILVEELEWQVRHHAAGWVNVYVDAAALGALGAEPLVAEVLDSLGLDRSSLATVADPTAQREAAELAVRAVTAAAARGAP